MAAHARRTGRAVEMSPLWKLKDTPWPLPSTGCAGHVRSTREPRSRSTVHREKTSPMWRVPGCGLTGKRYSLFTPRHLERAIISAPNPVDRLERRPHSGQTCWWHSLVSTHLTFRPATSAQPGRCDARRPPDLPRPWRAPHPSCGVRCSARVPLTAAFRADAYRHVPRPAGRWGVGGAVGGRGRSMMSSAMSSLSCPPVWTSRSLWMWRSKESGPATGNEATRSASGY